MIYLWVMDLILVGALLLLGGLLKGVLGAAKSIVPRIDAIAGVAAAASKDLDAVVILLTTQNYISQIVGSVADKTCGVGLVRWLFNLQISPPEAVRTCFVGWQRPACSVAWAAHLQRQPSSPGSCRGSAA
jgi:hypothetical protein